MGREPNLVSCAKKKKRSRLQSEAESTGPADFSLAQLIMWKNWELFLSIIATYPELKKKKKKKKYVLVALSEIV